MYFYKIKDLEEPDLYSEYLYTNKECSEIIEDAIGYWYDDQDKATEEIGANNVFESIEIALKEYNIEFKWIDFSVITY